MRGSAATATGVALGVRIPDTVAAKAASVRSGAYADVWYDITAPYITRGDPTNTAEQVLHTTLMRVDGKLGLRSQTYYLWFWTHDNVLMRLYTSSKSSGPFTAASIGPGNDGLCTLPLPPDGYDKGHLSAGDVVWDPDTSRFYTCPHSRLPYPNDSRQDTFLMSSPDGITWTYVGYESNPRDARPIIAHQISGYDDRSATYGRFMRDIDGNIARYGSDRRVAIFYRGEYWADPNNSGSSRLSMLAATAPSLGPGAQQWTKANQQEFPGFGSFAQPLFFVKQGGFNGALFGIGSAVYTPADGRVTMAYALEDLPPSPGAAPTTVRMFSVESTTPFTKWNDSGISNGRALFAHPTSVGDGPCIVNDNGIQVASFATLFTDTAGKLHGAVSLGYAFGP